MNFTEDWFSHNIGTFTHAMGMLEKRKEFLEIGCFEGRATCWMLQNGLAADGVITCIDTFAGGEEHAKYNMDFGTLRSRFQANVEEVLGANQRIEVLDCTSYEGLAECVTKGKKFDFIYIDGSHTAPDVLTDACMAFGMLNVGGVMLFDDYFWIDVPHILHRPKIAIDTFVNLFSEECEPVITGHQIGVRKL
jgi:predicted O-methyltransferase YrrM